MILQMDQWLSNYADLARKSFPKADPSHEGAGAAGGLGFAGCVTEDAILCNQAGIDAFFPIVRGAVSSQEAKEADNAKKNMAATVEQVFRLIKICSLQAD